MREPNTNDINKKCRQQSLTKLSRSLHTEQLKRRNMIFGKTVGSNLLRYGGTTRRCISSKCYPAEDSMERIKRQTSSIVGKRNKDLYQEHVSTKKQGAVLRLENTSREFMNFCGSDYLGLSRHPDVLAAGEQAWRDYGVGASSARLTGGTQPIHKELERKISDFHGTEDTMLYMNCYSANTGLFLVLLSEKDAVFSDELNHASIIDGIRLCKATKYGYKHVDMEDLEKKLIDAQKCRRRLIATDGVFSMDGDVAPLVEICNLADKYDAMVFVDECHATGLIGDTGRGTEELLGVSGKINLINSTLGKAFGCGSGGYTTGPKSLIEFLRKTSRTYNYTVSLPPLVASCASKAVDLLMDNNELAKMVMEKSKRFRHRMTEAGFTILGGDHPICPVMIDEMRIRDMMNDLHQEGVFVLGIEYPVVPLGKSRIRVQISALHTSEDIDKGIDAFIKSGKKHKVLP